MHRNVAIGLAALASLSLIDAAHAGETKYPLTIDNCGQSITFEAAPERDVTVGQSATEILYSLSLGDKVVGTSVWFSDVLPEFADLNSGIERLADNDPSFESVVAKKPDLVSVSYEWHIGPQGIVGTREQFHDVGIPTYILPTDCVKDNSAGVDGTRLEMYNTDALYRAIRELAEIHDVKENGEALVADLSKREAAAVAKAKETKSGDVSAVFWFSSAEMDVDPYVAGRKGVPGWMMEKLGLRNIVESDEEWPVVGWETIAKANPDIIVVAEMTRRRFPADDVEKKLEFLKTDPVAKEMDAVKAGRILVMDAHSMDPSIRNISALEMLADELPKLK
ncbi:ABC transporter substrate-binding protein [Afifella marina]|uniref:Iron complex transport system substrate-binding protein n=1 Tax=Afifella marina DSM 2698 TaxID=1120955 RepID=A0A1G5P6L7_AFIMA|nr:ABC transporter substrate-binding protein [Afifella marina]MBK1624839.1 ABC transporter substrate-binding protein [Afifella marina DSM 2698]MBK1628433.1 ABC transporter substrate-binding protein [Afifella marina]MBK5917920.1 ABC transporter substrate-binding protein [Afifella marina]RAI18740.1 ABC transporter substrate-binding protein [Afifella marina DSM 2698]SCZ45187.1 iron complex transport system substrate-binding protein [Afifella marina DSM 2698]